LNAVNRENYPVVLDYTGQTGLWRQSNIGDMSADRQLVNLPENRHNNGVNVLFHDGHAKWNDVRQFATVKITTGEYSKGLDPKAPPPLPEAVVGSDGIVRDARTGRPIAQTK
jgi:prepilin-type processing-associated H-X9-DG protein